MILPVCRVGRKKAFYDRQDTGRNTRHPALCLQGGDGQLDCGIEDVGRKGLVHREFRAKELGSQIEQCITDRGPVLHIALDHRHTVLSVRIGDFLQLGCFGIDC